MVCVCYRDLHDAYSALHPALLKKNFGIYFPTFAISKYATPEQNVKRTAEFGMFYTSRRKCITYSSNDENNYVGLGFF